MSGESHLAPHGIGQPRVSCSDQLINCIGLMHYSACGEGAPPVIPYPRFYFGYSTRLNKHIAGTVHIVDLGNRNQCSWHEADSACTCATAVLITEYGSSCGMSFFRAHTMFVLRSSLSDLPLTLVQKQKLAQHTHQHLANNFGYTPPPSSTSSAAVLSHGSCCRVRLIGRYVFTDVRTCAGVKSSREPLNRISK